MIKSIILQSSPIRFAALLSSDNRNKLLQYNEIINLYLKLPTDIYKKISKI